MRKPKVLIIAQLPPPVDGLNIISQTIVNSKYLNNHFDFDVLPLRYTKFGDNGLITFRKVIIFLKTLVRLISKIIKIEYKFAYFTIIPTGISFYRDVIITNMLKMFRIKVLFHLHGQGIRRQQQLFLHKYIYLNVFKNTDVILLSKLLVDDLGELQTKCRLHYVANCVKKIPNVHRVNSDRQVKIIFISNLYKSKGIVLLLEIAKELAEKRINFELDIVGNETREVNGEMLMHYTNVLGIKNYVKYLGPLYGESKSQAMQGSDILVLPTWNDCFPLVILEAMQVGIPVLSTDEGAIPEIVEDGITGFVARKKDKIDLLNKLVVLCENKKLRERMGQEARVAFKKKYSEEIFELNIKKVFGLMV